MTNTPKVEDLIILREAAKLLPGRPHISTLFRWIKQGSSAFLPAYQGPSI